MADILLNPTQRLVLQEACRILQTPPKGFNRGLWLRYRLGNLRSISPDDLGLIATHLPSIIDRLKRATNWEFLAELAMRISNKDTSFDQAIKLAVKYLATGEQNNERAFQPDTFRGTGC